MEEVLKKVIEENSHETVRFRKSLNMVYITAFFVHVFLGVLFYVQGVREMQVFNYFSPFVYLFCLYLNMKGKLIVAAFVGLAEASLHGIFGTLYVGWNSGFYYYLLLGYFLIFFLFRVTFLRKFLIALALTLVVCGLFLFTTMNAPKYILPQAIIQYVHLGNLFLTIVLLGIFALFYTYFLKKMEAELHASFEQMEETQISLMWQMDETKSIHQELVKEKTLLDALMNNYPDYIYFKDRESRFIRISRSMGKLFTVDSVDEMIGKSDFDFQSKKAAQKYRQDEEQIINTGQGLIDELVHEHFLTGIDQWVSTTKLPLIDMNNECVGTFGISKDVTYLKQLEIAAQKQATELRRHQAELQKKEEEQRFLNQQKNKFFSVFSHDLNNPLNALLGFTNLLAENYDNYTEEKRKKIIGNIVLITNSLQVLIANLLDWSRSQLNNLSISPEMINLSNEMEGVVSLYVVQQDQKHIDTYIEIEKDIEILADKNILQTIFRNLYSNALKFTHPAGKIRVFAKKTDEGIVIGFSDTGIGMSAETKSKLFSIGNTISQIGTLNEKGSGLGLIVCQEYLSRCNGYLTVESELDKGSTFLIHLPYNF